MNGMYLQAVYYLSAKAQTTCVSDIAGALSIISRPSVSNAIKKLMHKGWVVHQPYGDVRLTGKGSRAVHHIIQVYDRLRHQSKAITRGEADL